jgi:hypothetical protein
VTRHRGGYLLTLTNPDRPRNRTVIKRNEVASFPLHAPCLPPDFVFVAYPEEDVLHGYPLSQTASRAATLR